MRLDPARTAAVAIDMHRGHLDPSVATLPRLMSAALGWPLGNDDFVHALGG
jgi:hypothetical protein